MKKFINDINNVEEEMVDGIAAAYPERLEKLECGNVIIRKNRKTDKVALVSGGGSGHEPAHAGYVGEGMLDAAVSGPVFTSPGADIVYEAIKAAATPAGVLLVIKNYTGDVMNFEMAADMAEMEDIKVRKVIVEDDVAVKDSTYTIGRRGVAGTVFVHKTAGAKAEQGAELDEVWRIAQKACDNIRTMGAAITPCVVPAAGRPGFELAEDEIEIGIGIHGEPGVRKEKYVSADVTAEELLKNILEDFGDLSGQEVAVLVNGSGGTPLMELYIINNYVQKRLKEEGIKVYKTLVGNYMTSIEMQGFSITLMKLDEELKALLDAPAETAMWVER